MKDIEIAFLGIPMCCAYLGT